jgi:quinol monooxygenase YgiN
MPSVVVIARVSPKAETRQEFLALLEEVQAASRLDDGCENYGYYSEITDADRLVAVEEWRDMAALQAHLGQPHVQKLIAALPSMVAAAPSIVVHEVESSGGLPEAL